MRVLKLIINFPKFIILNNFSRNVEKFFCSIIYGNYSTIFLNFSGNIFLKKKSINLENFYNKEHFKFFKINLSDLSFDTQKFIDEIPNKYFRIFDSTNFPSFYEKITFSENKKISKRYKVIIDLLKLKKNEKIFKNKVDEIINILLNNEDFKKINKEYYSNKLKIVSLDIEQRYPTKLTKNWYQNSAYSTGFHFDIERLDTNRVFVSVEDLNINSGGTDVISYPETKTLVTKNFYKINFFKPASRLYNDDLAINNNDIKIHQFLGKSGSAIFFNPNLVLHRGNLPQANERRTLIRYFLSL